MNSANSDAELGQLLRLKAASLGYSPTGLLELAESAAELQRWSVLPNFPPFPWLTAELTIDHEHLICWPDWTAKLIPPESRIECLLWTEGTMVTRLVNPRGLVLAANIEHPSDPQ